MLGSRPALAGFAAQLSTGALKRYKRSKRGRALTPVTEPGTANIQERLRALSGWALAGEALEKRFELGSFPRALAFALGVVKVAEAEHPRPDIVIESSSVRLSLSARDPGGVTEKELNRAEKIEALVPPTAGLARWQGTAKEIAE